MEERIAFCSCAGCPVAMCGGGGREEEGGINAGERGEGIGREGRGGRRKEEGGSGGGKEGGGREE